MALVAIVVGLLGFGAAKGFRHYTWCQRRALLDPPLDLLKGGLIIRHLFITQYLLSKFVNLCDNTLSNVYDVIHLLNS